MFGKLRGFLLEHIATYFYACWAEKVLIRKIKNLKEKEFAIKLDETKNLPKLIKELKACHQKERDRKKIIEDKAAASLFVIGLSVTLILGSLEFIRDTESGLIFKFFIFSILIIGVIYLLFSGAASIKALITRQFYDEDLDDWIKENGNELNVVTLDNNIRFAQAYKSIKLNQLMTDIRSNYVYATFIGIRNGIILISFFFIIAVGNVFFSKLAYNNIDSEEIKQLENKVSLLNQQLIQQKDAEIKKLNEQVRMGQDALERMNKTMDSLSGELKGIKKAIDVTKKGLETANQKIEVLTSKPDTSTK